jgi:hypothetical protein
MALDCTSVGGCRRARRAPDRAVPQRSQRRLVVSSRPRPGRRPARSRGLAPGGTLKVASRVRPAAGSHRYRSPPFAMWERPAVPSVRYRRCSLGQDSGRRGRQVCGSVHTGSKALMTSRSCQAGASDREGGNDDHCDCDDNGQGEGDVEGPSPPSAPGHVRRWAKPAGEACWSGRRAVRHAPARLTLVRWMPSAVWALPPARRWTTPMPALPCIHPPVGASLVHRRTPNCPQRPSQASMAHPAHTQYAPAATHTGKHH